jgi:hypothetical protein
MKSASVFEWAFHAGIEYLTIWIFSDDNFKRSREEVDGLMRIFEEECEDKLYDGVLYTYQVSNCRRCGCWPADTCRLPGSDSAGLNLPDRSGRPCAVKKWTLKSEPIVFL